LTSTERACTTNDLGKKIPLRVVLNNIRSNLRPDEVTRLHLLQRQDLQNIARDFNIDGYISNHQNDADSVRIWVDKVRAAAIEASEQSYVRLVKFQGEKSEPAVVGVRDDDFFLILMTDVQITMLKKFGLGCCVHRFHTWHKRLPVFVDNNSCCR
jgi:hypothetical protein